MIFVTLVMVLVPHRSKESARDSYDECHGVAVSLWLATVSAITNLLKKKTPTLLSAVHGRVCNKPIHAQGPLPPVAWWLEPLLDYRLDTT